MTKRVPFNKRKKNKISNPDFEFVKVLPTPISGGQYDLSSLSQFEQEIYSFDVNFSVRIEDTLSDKTKFRFRVKSDDLSKSMMAKLALA